MSTQIATIKGQLHLTVVGSEPINLGYIEIPVKSTNVGSDNMTLNLKLTADLAQVREYVEHVFGATAKEVTP